LTHTIKNIAVVFYGQSRTYAQCAESIKTFFSTKNPELTIDFFCTVNTENSYSYAPTTQLKIPNSNAKTVVEDIKNLYNPVHMSVFSHSGEEALHFPIYTAILHALGEKKKYEIKENKSYDITITCRYDIKFMCGGREKLDTVFDFLINTINHYYNTERLPDNNVNKYNLPFFNPNIFVLSFTNSSVPSNWFRPMDIFQNGIEDFVFIGTGCATDLLFSIIANLSFVDPNKLPRGIQSDFKPENDFSRELACTHHDIARALLLEKINVLSLRDFLANNGTYFNFELIRLESDN